MISAHERRRMIGVPMVGERVVMRLEAIGVERMEDLRGGDPHELMDHVNVAAGRRIWSPPHAILALSNLIAAADAEALDHPPI